LKRMVKTGQNIYLSAEEAIKYGIADELMWNYL
jgi:ATP-dependent protease ClpP protease subunit